MTKAASHLPALTRAGNSPPIAKLTIDETAAALVAMLGGAREVPPRKQLRTIVAARNAPKVSGRVARVVTTVTISISLATLLAIVLVHLPEASAALALMEAHNG